MVFEDWVSGSYESRAISALASRTINLVPELVESEGGKNRYAFIGSPGSVRFADMTAYGQPLFQFAVKGAIASEDRVFCVAGTHLLEIDVAGVVVDRGSVALGIFIGGPRPIAYSGTQIFFSPDGTNGYVFTLATNVLAGPVANVTPEFIAFLDGYFIAASIRSRQFQISALYDGATWDPLDFAVTEASPGFITGLIADHGELWIPKQDAIQAFSNTGNADFPFEPIQGGTVPIGCIQGTMHPCGNALLFCGRDARGGLGVFKLNGTSPVRVSTHAIEAKITVSEPAPFGIVVSYVDKGHDFYGIWLSPGTDGGVQKSTPYYDNTSGLWHERAHYVGTGLAAPYATFWPEGLTAMLSHSHVYAWGKHLVLSASGYPFSYQISDDIYTDGIGSDQVDILTTAVITGEANTAGKIKRVRGAPYVFSEKKNCFFPGFELEMDGGVGVTDELDPTISLRWSNDGGRAWTQNSPRKIGVPGDYRQRIRWNRLGRSRGRIFEVNTLARCRIAITNAYLDKPEVAEH